MYVLIYKLESFIFSWKAWNKPSYVKKKKSNLYTQNKKKKSLYRNTEDECPCIVVVNTFNNEIFGAYVSDPF